jgi:hypothetical protein
MQMSQRPDRFLVDTNKPMRLAFLGFVIAAVGVALAFSIDYGPGNPLAFLAFGIVVLGVAVGFIAVAWGWATLFKAAWRRWRR